MTKEELREEAIYRMELIERQYGKLYGRALQMTKSGKDVPMYENHGGVMKAIQYNLYMNADEEDFAKVIKAKEEFEARHNSLVYLITMSPMWFGICYNMFYVSDTKEEWGYDREDLESGSTYAYVYNMDDDTCSEIGRIGFAYDPLCKGVYRVA